MAPARPATKCQDWCVTSRLEDLAQLCVSRAARMGADKCSWFDILLHRETGERACRLRRKWWGWGDNIGHIRYEEGKKRKRKKKGLYEVGQLDTQIFKTRSGIFSIRCVVNFTCIVIHHQAGLRCHLGSGDLGVLLLPVQWGIKTDIISTLHLDLPLDASGVPVLRGNISFSQSALP